MKTAIINIKTTPATKIRSQKVAENLGMSMSALINGFLHQLIKERKIEFYADQKEQPSASLLQSLKEAEMEIAQGKTIDFQNPRDALEYVEKLMKE